MSCAAPCLNEEFENRTNHAAAPRARANVVKIAAAPAAAPAARWTRSELLAVVGSVVTAVTLSSLLVYELASKLQQPVVF